MENDNKSRFIRQQEDEYLSERSRERQQQYNFWLEDAGISTPPKQRIINMKPLETRTTIDPFDHSTQTKDLARFEDDLERNIHEFDSDFERRKELDRTKRFIFKLRHNGDRKTA